MSPDYSVMMIISQQYLVKIYMNIDSFVNIPNKYSLFKISVCV